MHAFWTIVCLVGVVVVVGAALVGVLRDLLTRGPYVPPLIEDDGLAWPPRYQGSAPSAESAMRSATRVGETRLAESSPPQGGVSDSDLQLR